CAPAEHQAEVTAFQRIGRYFPVRSLRNTFVFERGKQFDMQHDWLGYAVHGQIPKNIATLRGGLFYAATLERNFRKLRHIKKFRAAQMIIALSNSSVYAVDRDPGYDRRSLRVFAIDVDGARK